MTVLRKLCDGGRTVIVVSHNVAYLGLADRILVLATGGQLAYYGPPDEALTYFGFTDYADMYAALEQPRTDWREKYEESPIAQETLSKRRAPIEGRSATPVDIGYTRNQTAGEQFKTLCARYLKVIGADRRVRHPHRGRCRSSWPLRACGARRHRAFADRVPDPAG